MNTNSHPKRIENPDARRPKAGRRDVDDLLRKAWEQGWWVEQTKKNHYKLLPPDRPAFMTIAGTASDHRALRNSRSQLRRLGLNI